MNLVNRERGQWGKFKVENASNKKLIDKEHGRDSAAKAAWAPACPGQCVHGAFVLDSATGTP